MKNRVFNSFLLLALVGMMFTACKKEYPEPPIQDLPIGTVYTIDEILAMEEGTVFNEDASVYGIITADEQSGNLYKSAFMQDRVTGAALELHLNAVSGVRIGDSVRIYLKDVTYAKYYGLPQLKDFEADGHIVILANNKPIEPAITTIDEIRTGRYLAGLVRLENVRFTDDNVFADPTASGDRTLVDASDYSKKVIVRTSNYANFANDSLPKGPGNLVAIASYYEPKDAWQMIIRSAKELQFEGYVPGGDADLPYYQDFVSSFGTYTTYDVAGGQSWEIDYQTAKMTGFVNSTNNANEDWLISKRFSLENVSEVSMTMTYIARYFNNVNEDITIQVSSDYTSGDPTLATWTQVPATLVEGNNWNEFATTTIDLSQFVGQKICVAEKYLSNDTKAGTIEVQSILIQEGSGPTPPPGPGTGGEIQSLPYFQGFSSDFGTYMTYDAYGAQSWMIDFSTAKMTGYVSSTNNANEDWLISSPVALTGVNDAKMTMVYIGRYFTNISEDITIWASTDYTWGSAPTSATWAQVPATLSEASNWNDFKTAEIALTQWVGQTVTFAVKYVSTDVKAGTIEIQSITIEEGSGLTPPPGPGTGGEIQSLPYTQSFATEFGSYTTYDVYGAQSWAIDYSTAKMTGFVSSTNNANEDWLISSPVAITGVNDAKMTMVYIGRYFNNINEDITIWASTDYTWGSAPNLATWTQVPATLSEASNWNDFKTAEISLTQWVGQTVTLAVKYVSTDVKAGTIEIQSITIEEGSGEVPPTPPTPGGELQYLPYSQSFVSEFGSYTTYDVLGSQSWMIDYSTAKMTGFVNSTNNANEDWLISSPVVITGVSDAMMTMVYIGRYFNSINEDVTIWASTDYTWGSAPNTATWSQVPATLSEASNWSDFKTVEIALTQWVGQTVTLAVKYVSTDVKAGTIEIQSITIEEGSADVPPTPPTPGEGEGSGTANDPYNVAAGIGLQSGEPTAWVQGYIVGAVKSGLSSVSGNSDINWSEPFDLATNVVIADDPTCQEISLCIIVNLPAGKPLRTQVNLMDNPGNLGKRLAVNGKLRKYFGQAGLRDSGGAESDFVLE
ncbi:MAG: DUF5689 domain-containing protein [Bacteroidales bacterium]|nr:DUF5689 domain-containing protein [Bacteroidales bacterium]